MAAPVVNSASISEDGSGTSATIPTINVTIPAPDDRILVIFVCPKDNSSTAADISTITFDSAGVNRTIGSGITLQGSRQLAQEGSYSSQVSVYFILEADLPAAGTYPLDVVMDSAMQYSFVSARCITGCPKQAYDAIVQGTDTANVNGGVDFSDSITPVDSDCLIVDLWSTSHSSSPTYTIQSGQTLVNTRSNTNGGYVSTQHTQVGGPSARTMTQNSSTLHQRRAWSLLSFSGVAGGNNGTSASALANATSSATGKIAVSGTSSVTVDNVTASGAGKVAVKGTSGVTTDNVVAAGSGTIGAGTNNGSSATILADEAGAANGKVLNNGSSTVSLGNAVASGAGKVGITGSSAITISDFSSSASGAVKVTGSSAVILEGAVQSASGAVLLSGQSATTLEDNPASGAGKVLNNGASSINLDNVIASGSGSINPVNNGASATILENVSPVGTGKIAVSGSSAVTLEDLIAAGFGTNNLKVVLPSGSGGDGNARISPDEFLRRKLEILEYDRIEMAIIDDHEIIELISMVAISGVFSDLD